MKLTDYFSDHELLEIKDAYQESDLRISSPDKVRLLSDLFEGETLEQKVANVGEDFPNVKKELFEFLHRSQ